MGVITINHYKAAYSLGIKHGNSETEMAGWYTKVLEAAYSLGRRGIIVDFDNIVTAERYGELPEGVSYNYRDGFMEDGVSATNIKGEKEVGSSIWFCDREKIEFRGILLPVKGSDGEPLLLPLDVWQYDFE